MKIDRYWDAEKQVWVVYQIPELLSGEGIPGNANLFEYCWCISCGGKKIV